MLPVHCSLIAHQRTHFYQFCKSLLTAGETPISDTLFRRMMATSKARLTSLPTEILSIIFSDESVGSSRGPTLSLTDLGAVRLSCKALQSPATAIFAQRYFQNPYVMIWKESLEALLDICRHPVFGPCVRKIEFLEGDYRSDPALGSADSVYDQDTATELGVAATRFRESWRTRETPGRNVQSTRGSWNPPGSLCARSLPTKQRTNQHGTNCNTPSP